MANIGLNQIIKESIGEMKTRQLAFTPENYTDVFNEISNKYGFTTEESARIQRYISRLSDEYKAQAQVAYIKNTDEFIAFAISRLNISSNKLSKSPEKDNSILIYSFDIFVKRLLNVIDLFKDQKATEIAKKQSSLLDKKYDEKTIDSMREQWFEFISNYDDSFLNFLKYYGVKSFGDLKAMMKELENFLSINNDNICANFSELVLCLLLPSISNVLEDDIKKLRAKIKKEPSCIITKEIQDEIKRLASRRVELDRAEISDQILSLNSLLENINEKVISLASSSHLSSEKMQSIKNDINHLEMTVDAFEEAKKRLISIADMLETESRELGNQMEDNRVSISELQEHIKVLEKELAQARQESKEDFLTKTATKRALMSELKRIEESYKRYGTNYSICFLDIDFFKSINDTYGHDAGDAILSAVAQVFKKYSREVDFIGRYGGEEFVVLLPNIGLKEAVKFADKLRKIIENYKFVYKNERIDVRLSCGVATRSANSSESTTLESADKMLYTAKENGRNQVMPQIIDKL